MCLTPGFVRQVAERQRCPNFVHLNFLSLLDHLPHEIERYQSDKETPWTP
jgi:hypothetical protein